MTHFTVLVRVDGNVPFDDIEEAVSRTLAPYDEGTQAAPYRQYLSTGHIASNIGTATRTFEYEDRKYMPTLDVRWTGGPPQAPKRDDFEKDERGAIHSIDKDAWDAAWDAHKAASASWDASVVALYDPSEVVAAYNRYWGDSISDSERLHLDEKGIYEMSTYNPQSRWDWWAIGGRWRGYFTVRDTGEYPVSRGDPGTGEGWEVLAPGDDYFENREKVEAKVRVNTVEKILRRQTDIARVQDLDWGRMLESYERELGEHYDRTAAETDPARRLLSFWEGPETTDDISREDYIARQAKKYSPATAAICDPGLGWVENGRTGWFGASGIDGDMTETEWKIAWREYVEGLDGRDWLVVVDCHI